MIDRVRAFIASQGLLSARGLQLVALSGGADSVALLLVLRQLGYRVEAVHCNFRLRGSESDRDEQFVGSLCRQHNVALHVAHFDTRAYASLHKVSIEMAARRLRYTYFEQLRRDLDAETVCVAHHRDDSAETVLLNLIRGTGIEGLAGIKPRNGHVVRPLLCVGRRDIEEWLQQQGQSYVTDSTNLVADVQRNKLRLDILPRLEQMLPGAAANILRSAQWAAEAGKVYRHAVADELARVVSNNSADLAELAAMPSPESLLYEWLSPLHFTPAAIAAIHLKLAAAAWKPQGGLQWRSATHQLVVHRRRLLAAPLPAAMPALRIPEPGNYVCGNKLRITLTMRQGAVVVRTAETATLDADKVTFPLTLRPVQQADRFRPFGMKGSKLVSDYLTDARLSPLDKQRQMVLCDAHGRIVWLVGRRPDARFCISPETRSTLVLSVEDREPLG